MKRQILALQLFLLLPSLSFAADDDLRTLVKTLSNQVQQLTQRVADLETELAREREARQQASMPQAPANNPAIAHAGDQPPPEQASIPVGAPVAASKSRKTGVPISLLAGVD